MAPKCSLLCSQQYTTNPCLRQINPIHILQSHFLKVHFNTTLPPTYRSSKWSLSFSLPTQTLYAIGFFSPRLPHIIYHCHIPSTTATYHLPLPHIIYHCHISSTTVTYHLPLPYIIYHCHVSSTTATYHLPLPYIIYQCHVSSTTATYHLPLSHII